MDTKLTLKLNQEVIEQAKKYAAKRKMSLSRIIEAYLQSLVSDKKQDTLEISAFVKSISTGTQIPSDIDAKEGYRSFLNEKYT
ncbi:hypothetical protein GCM10009117_07150 [Gangjinia marincola]|uniref:Antitoxin n=1 Tax=Gangjinia marincola TaxID=578463 RepID=A0ABP3XUS2_9FLAO